MDNHLKGSIVEYTSMPDLQDKIDIMCEVLLYNMAFNRYFNYQGQINYHDLFSYILRVSDNKSIQALKNIHINVNTKKDIKYHARYIKQYKNIKYNYSSLLQLIQHNELIEPGTMVSKMFINDLTNFQTKMISILTVIKYDYMNHSTVIKGYTLPTTSYKNMDLKDKIDEYYKTYEFVQAMILNAIQTSIQQTPKLLINEFQYAYIEMFIQFKKYQNDNKTISQLSEISYKSQQQDSSEISQNNLFNSIIPTIRYNTINPIRGPRLSINNPSKATFQPDDNLAEGVLFDGTGQNQTRFNRLLPQERQIRHLMEPVYDYILPHKGLINDTSMSINKEQIIPNQTKHIGNRVYSVYTDNNNLEIIEQMSRDSNGGLAKKYRIPIKTQWDQFVSDTTQKSNNNKYQQILWSYIKDNKESGIPNNKMHIFDQYNNKNQSQVTLMPSDNINKCINKLTNIEQSFRQGASQTEDQRYLFVENMPIKIPNGLQTAYKLNNTKGLYTGYLLQDLQTNKIFKHGPCLIQVDQISFPVSFEINVPNLV